MKRLLANPEVAVSAEVSWQDNMKIEFNTVGVALISEGDSDVKLLADLESTINIHLNDRPVEFFAELFDIVPLDIETNPSGRVINGELIIKDGRS